MKLKNMLQEKCGGDLRNKTNEEIYFALLEVVQEMAKEKEKNVGKKKLYYISAEFLIGKLLSNNLINLGIYDEVKEILEENGKNISEIALPLVSPVCWGPHPPMDHRRTPPGHPEC